MENELQLHEKLCLIQTSLVAPKSQFNKFGNYTYRKAEDILEAVKPLLKEHGLILVIYDDLVLIGDRYYVKATAEISDKDGKVTVSAFAREEETRKGMDSSQITGATSSYARKYALNGLFCIDDTKDADSINRHEKSDSKGNPGDSKPIQEAVDPVDDSHPPSQALECACGAAITQKVFDYSMKKFGKALCFGCQKGAK